MKRLVITSEADACLLSIAQWYAERSQSRDIAAEWYDGFLKELESLTQNPLRGALAAESNLFSVELREIHYGSGRRPTHRALYRIVGDTIEVLAIRHHAQRPLKPGEL